MSENVPEVDVHKLPRVGFQHNVVQMPITDSEDPSDNRRARATTIHNQSPCSYARALCTLEVVGVRTFERMYPKHRAEYQLQFRWKGAFPPKSAEYL